MRRFASSHFNNLLIAVVLNVALFVIFMWRGPDSQHGQQHTPQFTHPNVENQQQQQQQQRQHQQQRKDEALLSQAVYNIAHQPTREPLPASPLSEPHELSTFKVSDSLLETHDIAIPRDIPKWTDADTATLNTASGYSLMEEMLLQPYNRLEQVTDKKQIDFGRISRAVRLYKSLWDHVYSLYGEKYTEGVESAKTVRDRERALLKLAKTRPEVDYFLRLEQWLYPYLHIHPRKTSFSLYESFSGQGIVMCAGNNQFEFLISTVQAIRRLNPTIPIEVFHMGNGDLSDARQTYIREMTSHIELKDVTQILDNSVMILGGWSIKSFAMLASSFEEVMLVDADAFFLRDPAELFSDPGYKATGALFFYDRTLFGGWTVGPDFMRSIMPIMSSFPKTTRWWRGTSSHEQESGVVMINKRKRYQGLLSVCKMNMKYERDFYSYQVFYGDKETFWVGFEMAQEPYAFVKSYSGVIGERPDHEGEAPPSDKACGAQLHFDYQGRPLWWNGGLMRNKNSGVTRPMEIGWWKPGGGMQKHRERIVYTKAVLEELLFDLDVPNRGAMEALEEQEKDPLWNLETSCLDGGPLYELGATEKELTQAFLRLDRIARQDGERFRIGENPDSKVHDWTHL
ncbi:hypothetical protein BGZ94_003549 [Podila epigama]|nr:hypothetical protein BGZ94_003549 [Podila epigama]